MEVVLSTVRPSDLLMGKVLGIGVLGLVQLAVFVLAGGAAALATDRLVLPNTTPAALVLLVIWFILGYTLSLLTVLGFLGALASRMEEASNASTPVTMIAMVSYFVAIFAVVDDPDGTVATVADLPAALCADGRPAAGRVRCHRPWEIAGSIAITLAAIYALILIGGRVYALRRSSDDGELAIPGAGPVGDSGGSSSYLAPTDRYAAVRGLSGGQPHRFHAHESNASGCRITRPSTRCSGP